MDDAEQKQGEERVMRCLVQPLRDLGLGVPSGMNRGEFDRMIKTICAKLARMTEEELVDLREWALKHPGGRNRNQFPRALDLLKHAAVVAPPDLSDASPYIRRLMIAREGNEAMAGGFGPEFLAYLRENRAEQPGRWTMSKIRAAADDARRRFEDIEFRIRNSRAVTEAEESFRAERLEKIAECHRIRDLARQGDAA